VTDIDFSSLHVMVVEDEEFMRRLATNVLRELGVTTTIIMADGQEALDFLKYGDVRTDLILCDLQMPRMSGLQFLTEVRKGHANCEPDIPVIVLTGHAEEETVRAAVKVGIDGYLVKPLSVNALSVRMSAIMAKRR